MAEATITTTQQNQIELLTTLSYDTAAMKEAIAFIQDDPFKHRLFVLQYGRVYGESETVSRTRKAVQESKEALAVINGTESEK